MIGFRTIDLSLLQKDYERDSEQTRGITMPQIAYGIASNDVYYTIDSLIQQLVNIKNETGVFLLKLDGRVIDTKGWKSWEWTHGIGLYGLWKYHTLTDSTSCLEIIEALFAAWFAEGGTTKNVNTMAAKLPGSDTIPRA
jgi:unsaturated rhamnogalacturonyl hydrolase